MCEVDFSFPDNKKQFSSQGIENALEPLLKEKFEYKMEESELELALAPPAELCPFCEELP